MVDAAGIFIQRLAASRDAPFITGLDNHTWSYAEYWELAGRLAAAWRAQGMAPGDTIAFRVANSVMLPACYLSCAIGGFIACPIAGNLHPDLVSHMLDAAGAKLVVDDIPDPPSLPKARDTTLQETSRPFIIMFTSGSTGLPKAICHSFGSVVGSAAAFARLTGLDGSRRVYHVLPMAYMAGFLNGMLAPFMGGAHVVEGPMFSPETALDFWSRPLARNIDTLQLTPTIASALGRLTRNPETIDAVSTSIRQVQCTSAKIPLDIRHRFVDKFSIPLQDCYGITELGGPLTFQSREDADAFNDFTTPISEVEIELRADELWIRSPFAMLGYLEDQRFIRPFDEDGYMDTGDLARVEGGRIEITGRKKDIIIRGGVNVSPARLESILSLMPEVDDVAVVGHAHAFWGEQIVAFVVPAGSDRTNLADRVKRFANDRLGEAERPDDVRVLDALPRSFIGKIQKAELARLLDSPS